MSLTERVTRYRAARAARRDWKRKAEHWRDHSEFWERVAGHRARRIVELEAALHELREGA
ncbi:hypothetical protein SAMN06298212_10570 [Ruaniaceae bacterium KH17]|nr:hypothetical protein SAMN06298212_10570 [Ruaniaceae bacterium KH17]